MSEARAGRETPQSHVWGNKIAIGEMPSFSFSRMDGPGINVGGDLSNVLVPPYILYTVGRFNSARGIEIARVCDELSKNSASIHFYGMSNETPQAQKEWSKNNFSDRNPYHQVISSQYSDVGILLGVYNAEPQGELAEAVFAVAKQGYEITEEDQPAIAVARRLLRCVWYKDDPASAKTFDYSLAIADLDNYRQEQRQLKDLIPKEVVKSRLMVSPPPQSV